MTDFKDASNKKYKRGLIINIAFLYKFTLRDTLHNTTEDIPCGEMVPLWHPIVQDHIAQEN